MSNPVKISQLLKNVEAFDANKPIGKNYITCMAEQLDCCQKAFLKSLGARREQIDPQGVRVRFVFPEDIEFDIDNLDEH